MAEKFGVEDLELELELGLEESSEASNVSSGSLEGITSSEILAPFLQKTIRKIIRETGGALTSSLEVSRPEVRSEDSGIDSLLMTSSSESQISSSIETGRDALSASLESSSEMFEDLLTGGSIVSEFDLGSNEDLMGELLRSGENSFEDSLESAPPPTQLMEDLSSIATGQVRHAIDDVIKGQWLAIMGWLIFVMVIILSLLVYTRYITKGGFFHDENPKVSDKRRKSHRHLMVQY